MSSCSRARRRVLAALALACGVAAAPARARADAPADYGRFCAPCHGTAGDGQGPMAGYLPIPPRDFVAGMYKFQSTPNEAVASDEDLLAVIDDGLPGTPMPGWRALIPAERRRALVPLLKAFSPRFAKKTAPGPMALPPEPPEDAAALELGKKVYEKMQCQECHGLGGRGDGPSVPTLVDAAGRHVVPPDLLDGEKLRTSAPRDIVEILFTGMAGTPMPSYAEFFGEGEAWALARYVFAMRRKATPLRRFLTETPLTWRRPWE